jgi:hypothetical protein
MEKITRQQRRKMYREFGNNQWYIENWQKMKFIRMMDDIVYGGTMEAYVNDTYQCSLRKFPNGLRYLSIKRNDRLPIRNWQHLQQIKNDICGEESEGAELFPAMSRIADTVNQYHIWVLPEGEKFPFGFNDRLVNMNQLRLDGIEN